MFCSVVFDELRIALQNVVKFVRMVSIANCTIIIEEYRVAQKK